MYCRRANDCREVTSPFSDPGLGSIIMTSSDAVLIEVKARLLKQLWLTDGHSMDTAHAQVECLISRDKQTMSETDPKQTSRRH